MPPPIARVSYDSSTETITVEPDPLPVNKGVFILLWLKEPSQENAPWHFQDLVVQNGPTCFDNVTVHPEAISLLDHNQDSTCHGTFKYDLSVYDEVKEKVVTVDPFIDNRPD